MAEHPSATQPARTDQEPGSGKIAHDASTSSSSRAMRKLDCSEAPASAPRRPSKPAVPPADCQGR